jgi:hypothetical protein
MGLPDRSWVKAAMPQVNTEPLRLGEPVERAFVASNRSQEVIDTVAEPGKHFSLHGRPGGEISAETLAIN